LIAESRPDSEATIVNPSAGGPSGGGDLAPTQYSQLGGKATVAGSISDIPLMSPPGATLEKRPVWPWVVAGLAILFLLAIVIASVIVIPKMIGSSVRSDGYGDSRSGDRGDSPTPPETSSNSGAPTDESAVLAQLTELEKQWTVANVDGDKEAINRILADDYRGGEPEHTKKDYLDQLKPDPTIKSWEFQDLRLRLEGDRATLDGYLRQETTRGVEVYSFTDEFGWRDGRWQATGSRTTRVR
jgi:hypothetical protein